ncbi:hypothetical protein ACIQPQ_03605 [Streptomyces sp. NPDC091281]|uniref:hypothetical protein n=1 Tax=Streptomyces sp. NPDC091281 TaxID=3365985 RepID=UPI0037FA2C98
MSATTSSLIIGIVGILGTLFSGVLSHRSAMRAKKMELDHVVQQAREQRTDERFTADLEMRRASYGELNRALRDYYSDLRLALQALERGRAVGELRERMTEGRAGVRAAYAAAQMTASDTVLRPVGDLVQLLHHLYNHLVLHGDGEAADDADPLDALRGSLDRASEKLYETRQIMRADLGLTTAPPDRPQGYGVVG